MTQIAWAVGTDQNPWSKERSILLAHSDTNVRWPTGNELRRKEFAYFGARDERNEARQLVLAEHRDCMSPTAGQPATSAITRAAAAIVKIREARAELDGLIAHEAPLYVMRVAVEKLVK